jgi:hypothetical protein
LAKEQQRSLFLAKHILGKRVAREKGGTQGPMHVGRVMLPFVYFHVGNLSVSYFFLFVRLVVGPARKKECPDA